MASDVAQHKVSRNKDGGACWDGDATSFQEYEELSLAWEQSVPVQKRYLYGPRLANELTGTARRFIIGKRPDWISFTGGVEVLMEHLRKNLGLPQLPEMSSYLNQYFRNSRRRKNETMNGYITRKMEIYARAVQSLGRVQKRFAGSQSSQRQSISRATPSQSGGGSDDFHDAPEHELPPATAGDAASSHAEEPDDEEDEQRWDDWNGWQSGWHSWYDRGQDGWSSHDSWRTSWPRPARSASTTASWVTEAPELLPEFVQGWFLLQDSGLDTAEKNMVIAALGGDYSLNRVAQELRNQWVDDDLRRRDQGGRSTGWMTYADDDDLIEPDMKDDNSFLANQDLTDEGFAILENAEQEAQQAMATLREARQKQHQVKMSRQYFRTSFRGSNFQHRSSQGHGRRESTQPRGSEVCLACGGPHQTSRCPKRASGQASSAEGQESAPFVSTPFSCFAESEALVAAQEKLTTLQAMERGMAVIDGGATSTLGSVRALEQVMMLNQNAKGKHGVESVDLADQPVFGFGNSSHDKCLSTANLTVMADGREGQLRVHALGRGEGPVLFSIKSLRALGAVVDYENDLICFRRLNDQKIIPLEQSSAGHQLLPLTQDWYDGATTTQAPVPSLKNFL